MPSFDQRLRAFAKINLSLGVLARRADGFHEIRTVFQTITLADTLTLSWRPARRTSVAVTSNIEIPGENICARAAHVVLAATGKTGEVTIHIEKRIPMGGGLGGGSTDGAAALRWLAERIGRPVDLAGLAAQLGSDVPFFLRGGCALGAGRGEELYPLPHPGPIEGILLTPPVHVSTADAYRGLARPLASELPAGHRWPSAGQVAELAWSLDAARPLAEWAPHCGNDFEQTVFPLHPRLPSLQRRLTRAGADLARMTGSGAAIFGLWSDRTAADSALSRLAPSLGDCGAHRFRFLSRSQYQRAWPRAGA